MGRRVRRERLYQPLRNEELTSSRFTDFIASPNRAFGHVRQDGAWVAKYARDPDAQSPAGGVSSSARDMATWLRLQLGRGTLDGRELVKAAPLDETHRPQIVSTPAENPMVDRPAFYGRGWGVSYDEQGRIRWSHSGGFNLGAATCVNVLPIKQIGIVALTNSQPIGVPEAVCRSCLELLLTGKVERDWLALFKPLFAPDYGTAVNYSKPPTPQSPPLSAAAYLGNYHSELFGTIVTDAGLVLKLGPKQQSFALQHFARDVFKFTNRSAKMAYGPSAVTFTVGADQKATLVTIENLDTNGQGTFSRTPG